MDYTLLYGENYDEPARKARYDALLAKFKRVENTDADCMFSSPGRTEILGNHTDHQHGKVIVSAISCDILAAVKKTDNGIVKICSEGYRDILVSLDDLAVRPKEYGTSIALTRGVLAKIKETHPHVGGFTAHITSNVFKGAGVSSSAAFELLITEIVNDFYLGGALSPEEKAEISQYSENVYFNKPCGILDQMGISLGGLSNLDFRIPAKPVIRRLSKPEGYSFIITNTGGSHAALTEHYADIKAEMAQIAAYFGKKVLRDVSEEEFYAAMPALYKSFSGRAILRAKHIFDENAVVERAASALEAGDVKTFLSCINASGESSLTQLQNNAVPGETEQRIPLALLLSRKILGEKGACRVHGGGFAGTILAVVENDFAATYMQKMGELFGEENVFLAQVRPLGTTRVTE